MTLTIYLSDKIFPNKECSSFAMLICITVLLVWLHTLNSVPRRTIDIYVLKLIYKYKL